MARTLSSFTITEAGDDYLLTIEDESGVTHELTATYDQLDIIAEALIEHLDADDDDLDEIDDEDDDDATDKKPA